MSELVSQLVQFLTFFQKIFVLLSDVLSDIVICVPGMKTIVWSISHCHNKRDKVIMPSYFYMLKTIVQYLIYGQITLVIS